MRSRILKVLEVSRALFKGSALLGSQLQNSWGICVQGSIDSLKWLQNWAWTCSPGEQPWLHWITRAPQQDSAVWGACHPVSSELGLPQASLSLTFPIPETTLLSPTDLLLAQEIPDMSLNLLWSLSVNLLLQFFTSCRGTTEP